MPSKKRTLPKPKQINFMQNLIGAILSTLIFFWGYIFHLNDVPRSFRLFYLIFIWSFCSSIVADLIARIYTGSFNDWIKNIQGMVQTFFISLLYAVGIYLGVLPYLMHKHDILIQSVDDFIALIPTVPFWEFYAYFLIYKLLIYLAADFLADSITFQDIRSGK